MKFDAVIFDLLTALLDSRTIWGQAAGSDEAGLTWRREYLSLTYNCGPYRPYEDLVGAAAANVGLGSVVTDRLLELWDTLTPWHEAPAVLNALAQRGVALGIATNCSTILGHRAAARVGRPFKVVLTAEEVGFYKPRPEFYRAVLGCLGTSPGRTLFVAGSPADVPGAMAVGMPVYWHNRPGLPLLSTASQPLLTAPTLDQLPDML